ncbi:MAG: ammonium transporter [Chlorobium sp.]|jgi:Amt family ammonium transporter|uniref:ammonium transporter n=1 Tax=Chlorobium sp. TaxID=1095 RepID=UPI001DF3D8AB|nr:ammonium transporter [Chlorobium sp.]MBN1278980.1 ammonium transporter [Chlorobiaceae bacterium]MCF8216348.1 ammonium transporter [Chlorobium sp.]MCF8271251.1 ammonium transporter [Chlorobium sp.]MCF8287625.1 ammonium transporter [Chlorobium sp.]MCF8291164.1 ammonium transporter [Chlorobium sp.]
MLRQFLFPLLLLAAAVLSGGTAWGAEEVATDSGTTSWMLTSTALVLLMVPGLAMFYGGLVRTKNVIGTMMHSFAAMVIIGVLWPTLGYALSFGPGILGGLVGWDSKYFLLQGIDDTIMSTHIPEYVFAMFQGKFAIITPALIAGAFAERVNFKGYAVFIALWSIIVYSPICHWVWASDGFLFNLGAMGAIDFAGGTVVHISSGVTALVAALYLGARRGYPKNVMHPNNLVMTLMGAGLLWVGWFGFNAGSSIASNLDTARALTVTQIAAAAGAFTWMVIEMFQHGKATSLGVASGILAGLVAITPAAGVVQPTGALALGALAAIFCYLAIMLKSRLGYDDSLDAFGVHGVGGIVGALALTFFIRPSWMAEAAVQAGGSWTVWQQFGVQATAVGITIAYASVVSLILLFVVEKTIGLRISEDEEMSGLDHSMHGEQGYGLINLN